MRLLRYSILLLAAAALQTPLAQPAPCTDGIAQAEGSDEAYPCQGVDLLSHVSLEAMGSSFANDIWGWTDPETGKEYALVGLYEGTGIVDVSVPTTPVYLGLLPTHVADQVGQFWRDLKVYDNHVYAVSEADNHGVQVFDLTQLRDVASPPVTFTETAHYDGISSSHNIVINEESGFAYVVGAKDGSESACAGGLHMVDLSEPAVPTFAGCFAEAGYTHDAQCIVYDGPDADYTGQEICFAFNEDRVAIVDVTDKSAPSLIEEVIYPNTDYTHQGWLTEDRRFLIGTDEGDEQEFGFNTRTLVFDVSDLGDPANPGVGGPQFQGEYSHDTAATDHNLYIVGNYVIQANYSAGLRILDASALLNGEDGAGLEPSVFFDTYPENDRAPLFGAWSTYPFFESGAIVLSDQERGLFVLQPLLPGFVDTEDFTPAAPGTFLLSEAYPNPFTDRTQLDLRLGSTQAVRIEVFDVLGRRVASLFDGVMVAGEAQAVTLEGAGLPAGTYLVRVTGEDFAETRHVTLAQ